MAGQNSRLARLILACSVLAIGGCANTSQFGPQIATFSNAATGAAASFTVIDAQGAARYTAISEDAAVKSGRVEAPPGDCQLTSKGCAIVYRNGGQTSAVYQFSLMPKSVAFMTGVAAYANALNAIEKADASADIEAALNQGLVAISTVAGAMNVPAGAAVSAIQKPLASSVGWAFGQYQNSLKLQALQKATQAAQPIIQEAQPIIDAELQSAATVNIAALKQDFDDKDDAFSRNPTAVTLQAESSSARALNAALALKPQIFDALAAAHTELAAIIQNPQVSPEEAASAITTFAQQTQNMEQIAKAIK